MSIIDQKKKIFGNVGALRTQIEGLPQLRKTSSMPSINNNGDTIAFLCDLIKSLVGYESLITTINNTLVHSLTDIESEVKKVLKLELKSLVNCGVNPSIPSFLKEQNGGINFKVNKIDFYNIFQTSPNSPAGKILYNDIRINLLESKDFNTFLYQVIQNDGTKASWGSTTSGTNILDFKFESYDISRQNPNNTITVTSSVEYENKNLTDLNNDFIDSLTLFNTQNLVSNIIDNIFGTVSNFLNKSIKQLEHEERINGVVTKLLNSTTDTIDDSVFDLSNQEKQEHEINANLRKNGVSMLSLDRKVPSSISFNTLNNFNLLFQQTQSTKDRSDLMSDTISKMSSEVTSNSNNHINDTSVKMNFIQQIINNITHSIINSIISPKIITIFIINFKIIYGKDADFTDPIDFMKKNKNLIHSVMKSASEIIIKQLLAITLKKITELVSESAIKRETEKAKNTEAQILSLVGIPQEILRNIIGLT